jgi:hypothetical protein
MSLTTVQQKFLGFLKDNLVDSELKYNISFYDNTTNFNSTLSFGNTLTNFLKEHCSYYITEKELEKILDGDDLITYIKNYVPKKRNEMNDLDKLLEEGAREQQMFYIYYNDQEMNNEISHEIVETDFTEKYRNMIVNLLEKIDATDIELYYVLCFTVAYFYIDVVLVFISYINSYASSGVMVYKPLSDGLTKLSEESITELCESLSITQDTLDDYIKKTFMLKIKQDEKLTATISWVDFLYFEGKKEGKQILGLTLHIIETNITDNTLTYNNKFRWTVNETELHHMKTNISSSILNFVTITYSELLQELEKLNRGICENYCTTQQKWYRSTKTCIKNKCKPLFYFLRCIEYFIEKRHKNNPNSIQDAKYIKDNEFLETIKKILSDSANIKDFKKIKYFLNNFDINKYGFVIKTYNSWFGGSRKHTKKYSKLKKHSNCHKSKSKKRNIRIY